MYINYKISKFIINKQTTTKNKKQQKMVYASLQEAWGGLNDDFSRVPPENPYVVKDVAPPNPANFNSFQKKHNFTAATATTTTPQNPPPFAIRQSYFLNNHHQEEDEEYSQISTSTSNNNNPKVQVQPPHNHHYNKKVECVNMIAHLQTCKICSAELAENTRNVFIREFVLFAGCGLIMFLFLDLIRKIAQKS